MDLSNNWESSNGLQETVSHRTRPTVGFSVKSHAAHTVSAMSLSLAFVEYLGFVSKKVNKIYTSTPEIRTGFLYGPKTVCFMGKQLLDRDSTVRRDSISASTNTANSLGNRRSSLSSEKVSVGVVIPSIPQSSKFLTVSESLGRVVLVWPASLDQRCHWPGSLFKMLDLCGIVGSTLH